MQGFKSGISLKIISGSILEYLWGFVRVSCEESCTARLVQVYVTFTYCISMSLCDFLEITLSVCQGAGRGFCAGGDVATVYHLGKAG